MTGAGRGLGKGIVLEIAAAAAVVDVSGRLISAGVSSMFLPGTIDHTALAISVSGSPAIAVVANHSHERANLMV